MKGFIQLTLAVGTDGEEVQRFPVLILSKFPVRTSRPASDGIAADIISYSVDPEGKALPAFQITQTAVSFQENFLGYILSVMEVAEFSVDISVYASLVFVYKYPKGFRLSVEAFMNYAGIFSHFRTPV